MAAVMLAYQFYWFQ